MRINPIIRKAYVKYKEIETQKDLNKNKLSLSDYLSVYDILIEFYHGKEIVETFVGHVAEWFQRNGFNVTIDNNNVNYIISL